MANLKTPHNTMDQSTKPKKRVYCDDYFTLGTEERQPLNEASIEMWAKDLLDWGLNPANDARFISEWRRLKKISMHDWERLRMKYPLLQKAQEEVLLFIGEKKLAKAEDNKGNWMAIRHTLYRHSPQFAADEKYHADLKKESEMTKTEVAITLLNRTPEGDKYREKLTSSIKPKDEDPS